MNIFRKIVAGIGAVLVTATLMGLPDMSAASVPGVTVAGLHGLHAALVVARAY